MPFQTPLDSLELVLLLACEANAGRTDPEASAAILNVRSLVRRLRATGTSAPAMRSPAPASVFTTWKAQQAALHDAVSQTRRDYEVIAAAAKDRLSTLNAPQERWVLERALHRMGDLSDAECLHYKTNKPDGNRAAGLDPSVG